MFKQDELLNEKSCLNRAKIEEMVFTLLARDICAPATIRFWVQARIQAGKNKPDDQQMKDALECAQAMEAQRLSGEYTKAAWLDLRDR